LRGGLALLGGRLARLRAGATIFVDGGMMLYPGFRTGG
jgi:hypothetical protein